MTHTTLLNINWVFTDAQHLLCYSASTVLYWCSTPEEIFLASTSFFWSSRMIRMMSWYHRILCQLILGEYRWIYLNVSIRKKLEGKQYHFLKSIQVDEREELSKKWRIELIYKKLQVINKKESWVWSQVRSEKKPSEDKSEVSREKT